MAVEEAAATAVVTEVAVEIVMAVLCVGVGTVVV